MKKQYITPASKIYKISSINLCAASNEIEVTSTNGDNTQSVLSKRTNWLDLDDE